MDRFADSCSRAQAPPTGTADPAIDPARYRRVMDLGFAVPISGSWATADRIVALATRAEELGYTSLWTFQRLLSPVGADDKPQLPPQYRSQGV